MSNKKVNLDELPKAVSVKEKYYEITDSDGKTYLCELLESCGINQEGTTPHHTTAQEKENVKRNLSKLLSEKNLTPDIIHKIDSVNGKSNFRAENSIVSQYILYAYKIKKELSQ